MRGLDYDKEATPWQHHDTQGVAGCEIENRQRWKVLEGSGYSVENAMGGRYGECEERKGDMESVRKGRYGECEERKGDMESVRKGREIWRVWGKGGRYGECEERKGDMESVRKGREIWRV